MATGRTVHIEAVDSVELVGDLAVLAQAVGLVWFAHGSGSSRHSRRNQAVAATLRDRGLATLLLDLLTAGEEAVDALSGQLRFDIDLLAGRVTPPRCGPPYNQRPACCRLATSVPAPAQPRRSSSPPANRA